MSARSTVVGCRGKAKGRTVAGMVRDVGGYEFACKSGAK